MQLSSRDLLPKLESRIVGLSQNSVLLNRFYQIRFFQIVTVIPALNFTSIPFSFTMIFSMKRCTRSLS